MTPVFADTSYYLVVVNRDDENHLMAVELGQSLLGRIYVTEYVLLELGNALSKKSDRELFLDTIEVIDTEPSIVFVPASQALFREAVDLFASRPDKEWSLVDCTSFAVMKQHRLREALTADRHFVQAGFKALMR